MRQGNLFLSAAIVVVLAVGLSLPTYAATSQEAAISQLELHADRVQREIVSRPKMGSLVVTKLRRQVREIRDEVARLEAGARVDDDRLAALLGEQRIDRSREAVARRAAADVAANQRRLVVGPKLGSLGR